MKMKTININIVRYNKKKIYNILTTINLLKEVHNLQCNKILIHNNTTQIKNEIIKKLITYTH
jgi:hypothetical protein